MTEDTRPEPLLPLPAESLASAILEVAAIIVIDGHGRIRYATSVVGKTFDIGIQALRKGTIATFVEEFVFPDDRNIVLQFYANIGIAGAGEPVLEKPFRVVASNGSIIWVEQRVRSYMGSQKEQLFMIQFIDVTRYQTKIVELAKENVDLHRENERFRIVIDAMKDTVAQYVHEALGVFSNMRLYVSMLLSGNTRDWRRTAGRVQLNTEHAARTLELMREASREERGVFELITSNTDVTPIIVAICEAYKFEVEEKGLNFHIKGSPLPIMKVDPEKIGIVVRNLVANAIFYTTSGGIEVSYGYKEGDWVVRVADTGPGIKPEEREEIFKKDTRGQVGQNSGKKGLGLGLFFSRKIMEAHGGGLVVHSIVGEGSVFTMRFPNDIIVK